MSNFHMGQMVVCVDDGPGRADPSVAGLERGRIYEVLDIGITWSGRPECRVQSETKLYWHADRFRPVKRTSIEVFHKLVAPIKGEKVS